MDIWKKMYEEAQKLYDPHEVSDFVYANHVVAAVEAEDGQIFTGFCMEGTCGVFHLCAERAALFNMYQFSGQTKVKKVLAFRDKPPYGGSSGMPCGACREFLLELNAENKDAEFMMDYNRRKTVKVAELMPYWWGEERASKFNEKQKSQYNSGSFYYNLKNELKKLKKLEKVVDKNQKGCIIVRVENNNSGPLVKGLRHRLFTAVTRVRIPYGLWYVAVETLDEKKFQKNLKKFQKSVDKRKRL